MTPASGIVIAAWMYWPAAFMAAGGAALLYFSLFHDRAKGRRRCRRCWYDMSASRSLPARCPECGSVAVYDRELTRTRRRWLPAVLAVLMLLPLGLVFRKLHARAAYYALMPKWKLVEETRSDATTISLYEIRDPLERGGRIIVKSNGRTVIDHEDSVVSTSGYKHERPTLLDLDSDGVMECVIECYSGGAHCCFHVYIVSVEPKGATVVADIDAQNGMGLIRPKGGGDGWLVNIPDQSFVYWRLSYAESPKPSVFYRLKDGALRVDLAAMESSHAGSEANTVAAEAAIGVKDPAGRETVNPLLWGTMLDLIYGGNEPQAWMFLARAWPGNVEEREKFRKEFLQVLATDPWYQDFNAAKAARDGGRTIPPSTVGISGRPAGK